MYTLIRLSVLCIVLSSLSNEVDSYAIWFPPKGYFNNGTLQDSPEEQTLEDSSGSSGDSWEDDSKSDDGVSLAIPDPKACKHRLSTLNSSFSFGDIHYYWSSYDYGNFYSDPETGEIEEKKFTWLEARNKCREKCMETVSFDSYYHFLHLSDLMVSDNIDAIWTSGRRCDKDSGRCTDSEDAKPWIVNGWYWRSTLERIPPVNSTFPGWEQKPWSFTGPNGLPQPDNAEQSQETGVSESCLAVLNNHYDDGPAWHDLACYHKLPFLCMDSTPLLKQTEEKFNISLGIAKGGDIVPAE